jgi:thioredoxin
MSDDELEKIRLRKVEELLKFQSTPKEIINVNNPEEFDKLIRDFPDKIIIIDFWAVWCSPCKMYAPIFKKAFEEYSRDFIFAKVNTDENTRIAQHFGISSIPTTLFIKNGNAIRRFAGVVNYETLRQILESFKS